MDYPLYVFDHRISLLQPWIQDSRDEVRSSGLDMKLVDKESMQHEYHTTNSLTLLQ